jgi:hypothetical protein
VTEEQTQCLERLRDAGAEIGITRGLDEALTWLAEKGLLRGRVG